MSVIASCRKLSDLASSLLIWTSGLPQVQFYLPYLTTDCHACCRQHVLARKRDHVVEWFKCILLQFQVLWLQVHIITHEDFSIMRVS